MRKNADQNNSEYGHFYAVFDRCKFAGIYRFVRESANIVCKYFKIVF